MYLDFLVKIPSVKGKITIKGVSGVRHQKLQIKV